ncbi:hypothetical protein JCM11491_005773 [Sporobolomyces phaffii]
MALITQLPVEILLEILKAAAHSSRRNSSLVALASVCKPFRAPALYVLFERVALFTDRQALSYLAALESAFDASTPATWTRRLNISYRSSSSSDDDAVRAENAIKVFYAVRNLVHLRIESDDELSAFESAIRRSAGSSGGCSGLETKIGSVRTVKLVGTLRWDRLVHLLRESRLLKELQVGGLYRAEAQPPSGAGGDDEPSRSANAHDPSRSASDLDTNSDTAPFEDSRSLERPASPVPAPPRAIPSFPRFDHLRLVRLDAPALDDDYLLSIVAVVRHSLESFALVDATCFSREALIVVLRNLRNIFELELSNCTFPDSTTAATTVPARRGRARQPVSSVPTSLTAPRTAPRPDRADLTLPDSRRATSSSSGSSIADDDDDSDPYAAAAFDLARPISNEELRHPLDYVALYCPFLQSLKLSSRPNDAAVVSAAFFSSAVSRLPLEYLTIGVVDSSLRGAGGAFGAGAPAAAGGGRVVGAFDMGMNRTFRRQVLVDMVVNLHGRLQALSLTKEMMWDEFDREWLKASCVNFGIVYSSEPSPSPRHTRI